MYPFAAAMISSGGPAQEVARREARPVDAHDLQRHVPRSVVETRSRRVAPRPGTRPARPIETRGRGASTPRPATTCSFGVRIVLRGLPARPQKGPRGRYAPCKEHLRRASRAPGGSVNPFPRLVLAGVAVFCLAAQADVDGGPNVQRLGRTVMRWRDDDFQLVVGYKHAQAHLDKKWILLDTYLTARGNKPIEVWREDVSLADAGRNAAPAPDPAPHGRGDPGPAPRAQRGGGPARSALGLLPRRRPRRAPRVLRDPGREHRLRQGHGEHADSRAGQDVLRVAEATAGSRGSTRS